MTPADRVDAINGRIVMPVDIVPSGQGTELPNILAEQSKNYQPLGAQDRCFLATIARDARVTWADPRSPGPQNPVRAASIPSTAGW